MNKKLRMSNGGMNIVPFFSPNSFFAFPRCCDLSNDSNLAKWTTTLSILSIHLSSVGTKLNIRKPYQNKKDLDPHKIKGNQFENGESCGDWRKHYLYPSISISHLTQSWSSS